MAAVITAMVALYFLQWGVPLDSTPEDFASEWFNTRGFGGYTRASRSREVLYAALQQFLTTDKQISHYIFGRDARVRALLEPLRVTGPRSGRLTDAEAQLV